MRLLYRRFIGITAIITVATAGSFVSGQEQPLDFARDVMPLLQLRCLSCHSGAQPKGEFSLENGEAAFLDGYIEPGSASESHLVALVTPVDGKAAMPKDSDPLTQVEIATLRKWIDEGANWPPALRLEEQRVNDFDWWSYQPLIRPPVPQIDDPWAESAIDRFILDKLNQQGLTPSKPADRRTLIRRVTYDLTGLPPTPLQVDRFINSTDPQAYEKLVDHLLHSKHYGERWARHWLDVVKYADTHGYDKDKLRGNAWPYRDYVIRSFNDDKPYSRFVQEQIAGDVLFPGEPDGILGLGFIAAGPWDFIGHVEVSEDKIDGKVARNLDRDDMLSNTLNTFCSLTIQCARCHNHKFDPITMERYYGLQSLFAAVDRADRTYMIDPEVEQQRAELETRLADLQAQVAQNADQIKELQDQLSKLPKGKMVYAAATNFTPQGNFKPTAGVPRMIHLLHRGNIQQPGQRATPCFLPLHAADNFQLDAQLEEDQRRAALARWLTRKDHPLVWRSIVNRIWQYHFGRGIVETPNDFGRMGAKPTHPELLDWLAAQFRDSGESMKSLHRLIVTSNVYQQSSQQDASNAQIDASNQYLWRSNRRRLTAEEIRDSMLAISGSLDREMGGPGFYLFELEKPEHSPHYEYHKFDPSNPASHRRSIYRFIVRSQPDPWMTNLDCADSSQSTPRRNETLTSLQALSMLNNAFNLEMSKRFATRLELKTSNQEKQVRLAIRLVLQRPANMSEQMELVAYARTHGLSNMCRILFNLSEFIFLD